MKVLALNPFHTGSHAAFLSGWIQHSRHQFRMLTLPGRHWKWRMRHAAMTLACACRQLDAREFDAVFTTDMLDLPSFLGLAPQSLGGLPCVVYLHENQFSYPDRSDRSRDMHFAYTNFLSVCRADQAWFNSSFHRDRFLVDCRQTLVRFPDHQHVDELDRVARNSQILPPGIEIAPPCPDSGRDPGPIRIAWVSRWEHDKNPEQFFEAMQVLAARGTPFELFILGESYREVPTVFTEMRRGLARHIRHWGYAAARDDYLALLCRCDIVVTTALHEFFGIAVAEAMSRGCVPVVPDRLAYPELVDNHSAWLYDGSTEELVERIQTLARQCLAPPSSPEADPWIEHRGRALRIAHRYEWKHAADRLDSALESLITSGH